ncbi:MAG TPA: hypothetical protein VLZ81_12370, partial [Blastocatellia bacterium]|nr:hypothetical protein [Blastocatellia bacterium]
LVTTPNPDEIDEEVWLSADAALAQLDLPYQILLAVKAISGFSNTGDLFEALEKRSFDEDYWV